MKKSTEKRVAQEGKLNSNIYASNSRNENEQSPCSTFFYYFTFILLSSSVKREEVNGKSAEEWFSQRYRSRKLLLVPYN